MARSLGHYVNTIMDVPFPTVRKSILLRVFVMLTMHSFAEALASILSAGNRLVAEELERMGTLGYTVLSRRMLISTVRY